MSTTAPEPVSVKPTVTSTATPLLGLAMIVGGKGAIGRIGKLISSVLKTPKGPAFDEIVVVDTTIGATPESRSELRDEILEAFKTGLSSPRPEWGLNGHHFDGCERFYNGVRVVLATYADPDPITLSDGSRMISDFAAARNFSFSLATAQWVAYLDHDDLWPKCEYLRPFLAKVTTEKPHINCIVLPYQYTPAFAQDKFRIMKRGTHVWVDAIHEWPKPVDGKRVIFRIGAEPAVIHEKEFHEGAVSHERNMLICEREREKAIKAGDVKQAALMAHHIGVCKSREAEILGQPVPKTAYALLGETIKEFPFQNMGAYAFQEIARAKIRENDLKSAGVAAGSALAYCPEQPQYLGFLAYVHAVRGNFLGAEQLFDLYFNRKLDNRVPVEQQDDELTQGWFRVYAALVYLRSGRFADAEKQIDQVSIVARYKPELNKLYEELNSEIQKIRGLKALGEYVEYLLQAAEPIKAYQVIKDYAPAAFEESIEVATLARGVKARIPQTDGWKEYKRVYDEMPSNVHSYDPDDHAKQFILSLGRCRGLVEWGKNLAKTHPTATSIEVLSIGFQEGLMERELLKTDLRIKLTVCDASDKASIGFEKMSSEFPGRVTYHPVKYSHYDWPDRVYDGIVFFEVLEHLPDTHEALTRLRLHLQPETGTLLLSTPVSERWVEKYLTDPKLAPKYLYHLKAFNPTSLFKALRLAGFSVERMTATDFGKTFFVTAKAPRLESHWAPLRLYESTERKVAIFVPDTPLPFDPDSVHKEHVGGSEEAVIYLAPELAKLGYWVTVYSPRPPRTDDVVIHAQANVLWRSSKDFDPQGDHGQVLFWRCPQVMQYEEFKAAPYKKHQWLHDATYYSDQDVGSTPEGIAAAAAHYGVSDSVIVLTKAHAEAIRRWDGYAGTNIRHAMNGIRVSDFPELTPEVDAQRDPYKVVWGSSPDRGLHCLLELWPLVKAEVPQATLDIYYAWGQLEKRNPVAAKVLKAKIQELTSLGVRLVGGVSHDELHATYRKASVYGYAQTFYEIYMISAIKAAACGAFVLANNYGSLREVVPNVERHLLPEEKSNEVSITESSGQRAYADALIAILKNPPTYEERKRMSDWARAGFGWDKAAQMFAKILG